MHHHQQHHLTPLNVENVSQSSCLHYSLPTDPEKTQKWLEKDSDDHLHSTDGRKSDETGNAE